MGENDRLIGTVTDRDITLRAVAEGRDPATTTVREVMSEGIHYCFDDQSIEEAADLMSEAQIRRLPIVNRDKRLVGIVALTALATEPTAGSRLAKRWLACPTTEPVRIPAQKRAAGAQST